VRRVVPVERRAEVADERCAIDPRLDAAHREIDVGEPVRVARDHREEELAQVLLVLPAERADRAEVVIAEPPVGQHEHVAWMRVGVEHAVLEHLYQEESHQFGGKPAALRAVRRARFADDLAGREFHREHAAGGERPVHPGHAHGRLGRVLAREPFGIRALEREVELLHERVGELLDERRQAVLAQAREVPVERTGGVAQQREIRGDRVRDPGALDLDDDRRAVGQARTVDLRHGSRRERRLVEPGEEARDARAELALDDPLRLGAGERTGVAVQAAQLGDDIVGEDVGAHAQHLPELHERGSQLLERRAQARRIVRLGARRARLPLAVAGEAEPLGVVAPALRHRDARDLREPRQLAERQPGGVRLGVGARVHLRPFRAHRPTRLLTQA
jgi:hypothetical protein